MNPAAIAASVREFSIKHRIGKIPAAVRNTPPTGQDVLDVIRPTLYTVPAILAAYAIGGAGYAIATAIASFTYELGAAKREATGWMLAPLDDASDDITSAFTDAQAKAFALALESTLQTYGIRGQEKQSIIHGYRPDETGIYFELTPPKGFKADTITKAGDDFLRDVGATAMRLTPNAGKGKVGLHLTTQKPKKQKGQGSTTTHELSPILQKAGIHGAVTETRSHQYRIILVENETPAAVRNQLPAISMKLGINEDNLKFEQNYQRGISAILIPLNKCDWKPVTIDKTALVKGQLIGYVGKAINGENVTYDRRVEPHLLVAGSTNSGKTEALRVDMESMRLSGLNPMIYIIDPKEDLESEKCEWYTSDVRQGVAKLETLAAIADQRKAKYNKAGCKNYFEYLNVDPTERPIMVYADEAADLLAQDLLEELEDGEHPIHKRAFGILYYISRKNRAGGLFLTIGIQDPKADTLKTEIRNNLGGRLVLSVADSTASKVALGSTGAETLPKFGGFMFKTSLHAPIIGRGAYIDGGKP